MKLDEVKPWGRSLDEYRRMFHLSEADLRADILGCGDGPASFNSEMTTLGYRVVSVDPLYAFSREEIEGRVRETYDLIVSQTEANVDRYVWTYFKDTAELGQARLEAMRKFLEDFDAGLAQYRYLPQALPSLNFTDKQFQLSLCSHLLFLYSEQLSLDFHIRSVAELLRVSNEVRVFPLVDLMCRPSPHVEPVRAHFTAQGFTVETCTVPYEFQKGGDKMMRICS